MKSTQQVQMRRMKWSWHRFVACSYAATAFALIGTGIAFAQSNQRAASSASTDGSTYALIPEAKRMAAPEFTLTDINGKKLALAAYRGKVVLLDFWAVDCGACKIEIPWYVEFDSKYRTKGLALIGVDMYGEAPDFVRPFMQKSHMDYPVAIGNDAVRSRFHAEELPMTLLIDRKGRIAVSHVGIVDKAQFEQDIQKLLQ